MTPRRPDNLCFGVVGAGTMGAGITQLAAEAGWQTMLHDPIADTQAVVAKMHARWEGENTAHGPLTSVKCLDGFAHCDIVVEAIPERLDLKRELIAALGAAAPGAVLCSNTSSLPITAIAAAAPDPTRVVGMHFFNPVRVMGLVEVVAGLQSSRSAVQLAHSAAEAMGKRVIQCADVPGFIVNRVNRPFSLEAVRCLSESVADVATIDRIYRVGGAFRMGPFELQDLVGLDVSLDVATAFHQHSFGEPRWRPSELSAQMVRAGWLGQKSGRGWYSYGSGRSYRGDDPESPPSTAGAIIEGTGPVATALRHVAKSADGPVIAVDGLGGQVGGERFYAVAPLRLVEVTGPVGESAFRALGFPTARITESPGGVLPRMLSQLVNEACFATGDGIADADAIDEGLVRGLNHPRGPFEWLALLGSTAVLQTLEELRVLHGDAYRPARALLAIANRPQRGRSQAQMPERSPRQVERERVAASLIRRPPFDTR